jgi:hypothetical protein
MLSWLGGLEAAAQIWNLVSGVLAEHPEMRRDEKGRRIDVVDAYWSFLAHSTPGMVMATVSVRGHAGRRV